MTAPRPLFTLPTSGTRFTFEKIAARSEITTRPSTNTAKNTTTPISGITSGATTFSTMASAISGAPELKMLSAC